jgi:parallel beta-helix repeat protein
MRILIKDSRVNKRCYTILILAFVCCSLNGTSFTCSSTAEIQNALASVSAGDTILITPGTYSGPVVSINGKGCDFGSERPGTADAPITIKSANPSDTATLCGPDIASNYVFYLNNAGHWIIGDLKLTGSQKGIVLDNSSNARISSCEVFSIGMEGIHIRSNSSNCIIEDCSIHATELSTGGYGEGIYIGTDRGSWNTYGKTCYDNPITRCTLGPDVAAEHVDIKEGTRRTIVEYCTFNAFGFGPASAGRISV